MFFHSDAIKNFFVSSKIVLFFFSGQFSKEPFFLSVLNILRIVYVDFSVTVYLYLEPNMLLHSNPFQRHKSWNFFIPQKVFIVEKGSSDY